MEPSHLRRLMATLISLFFLSQIDANTPSFNTDEIKLRFEAMACIVTPRYTTEVESYIKRYLAYNGSTAKRVMGRAAEYFPIFEKYLDEHNLPQDLKYLAIVESALNPTAVSPAGARGLWQFMSQTGRNYALDINKNVDERYCPYNSTEAAMQYLAHQFERFGTWELALAAYNCGAGVINNAMKRARTQDYWALSKYLPRETRNFVPAFLGAAYVANYYHLHDIEPDYPSLDMQLTEAVKVFDRLDFTTIAAVTALPVEVVTQLNPAFKNKFVPERPEGHLVILPQRVASALTEYQNALRPDNGEKIELPPLPALVDTSTYKPEERYFKSAYIVTGGDKIDLLAYLFKCTPYNIKVWNNLTSYTLKDGQELSIWFPTEYHHFLPEEEKIEVAPTAALNSPASAPEVVMVREVIPVPSEMPALKPKISTTTKPAVKLAPAIPLKKQEVAPKKKPAAPSVKKKPAAPSQKKPTVPKPAPKVSVQTGHGIL
ncbi:MAG: transglycosylase SLT domain-containing protein [Bacteroidetes bacterium]|nr:transglycosylase SLT domain-containing protein [Bacteroidota bacterium]